jgi:hypothetical protein
MAFIFRKPRTPVKSLTSTCPAPGAHSIERSANDPKRTFRFNHVANPANLDQPISRDHSDRISRNRPRVELDKNRRRRGINIRFVRESRRVQLLPRLEPVANGRLSFAPHLSDPAPAAESLSHRHRSPIVSWFIPTCPLPAHKIRVAEAQAMTQPAKRMPQWLSTDLLVIVVSLAIISIWIWIGP